MKNRIVKYLVAQSTEIAIMLLLVSLFFGIITTLLFKIFPAGLSLSQILEQRRSARSAHERRSSGGELDLQNSGGYEQAVAVLSQMGNDVRSKGASSIAWGPAREGMKLQDRDAVQTFTDSSAQINFDSRNYLIMGSNSLVIIKRIEKESAGNQRRSAIVVVEGQLRARIASGGDSSLQLSITTPTATIKMVPQESSSPGTDFKISVNPDRSSTIVVLKGEATVSANGKTVKVSENKGVTIKQGEAPKSSAPLPTPPATWSPADGSVIPYRDLPPAVRLAWLPGKGGARYHLQLAKDRGFKQVVLDSRLSESEFTHGNLKKGEYFWRVSRIDDGVEGGMSKTATFQVLQNLTPPPLEVTFPGAPVLENRFVLVGSTSPGNRVFVRGAPVATDEKGRFSCEVPIKPGMTLVTVEALDATGNVTYRSRYVEGRF